MSYEDDGYLTTDKRDDEDDEDSILWTSESDWNDAQETQDIEIDGGSFRLGTSLQVVEDWESGDLSNYNGDTDGYNVQTGTVFEGEYAVNANPSSRKEIWSHSGLNAYPERGDFHVVYIYLTDEGFDMWPHWALNDSERGYAVKWFGDGWSGYGKPNWLSLEYTDIDSNVGEDIIDEIEDVPNPTNEWIRYEIDFQDTITVEVYRDDDDELLHTLSGEHTSGDDEGGVGWYSNQSMSGEGYSDYWIIQ